MSATKSICPICGSKRIIHARHDSDWGGGNSCSLANSNDCYTEDDLRDEKQEQIYGDIDIFVCKNCNCIWDVYDNDAIGRLTASRDAWKKLAEELEHPKHAYRYYCMWCGNLLVNIGHSPDCPIEQLRKLKEGENG